LKTFQLSNSSQTDYHSTAELPSPSSIPPEILRLSVDLDLNYRHKNTADWGEARKEIDKRLKDILYRQGYDKTKIAISASYPLTRYTIKYLNATGAEDTCKIEIGYMRKKIMAALKTCARSLDNNSAGQPL